MSTADLLVSLKIDEGSNLDNLRKQLEALVGKRGEKPPEVKQIKLPKISRAFDWIKQKLAYITKPITPRTKVGQQDLAQTLKRQLKDLGFMETIAEKLNLSSGFQQEIASFLNDIASGITYGLKEAKFMNVLKDIISELVTGGKIKTSISELLLAFPESRYQERVEKSLKEMGIQIKSQYQGFTLSKEWLKANAKKLEKIKKDRLEDEEVNEYLKMLKDADVISEDKIVDFMTSAFDVLGIDPDLTEELIAENILDNPKFTAMLLAQIERVLTGGKTFIGGEFYRALRLIAKGKGMTEGMPKRPDLYIINKLDNLGGLEGENAEMLKELLDKHGQFVIELKPLLQGLADVKLQLKTYGEMFGKVIVFQMAQTTPGKKMAEELGITSLSYYPSQADFGKTLQELLEVDKEEAELTEDILAKSVEKNIANEFKSLQEAGKLTEEDKDAIESIVDDVSDDLKPILVKILKKLEEELPEETKVKPHENPDVI